MSVNKPRRRFLATAIGGGSLLGLSNLAFWEELRPVSAAETRLDPEAVQFPPEIEPLVRLIEETPRGRLLEEIARRIRAGLSYRQVLAALLLAGIRNVQPRPSVGFKFHAVLVVNSAHLASLASPSADRWLPIFWALDEFKSSQARDVQEGNWTMPPVKEASIPPSPQTREAFVDAMRRWDEEAVDGAVAGLVRTAGANELFELFARYGARDFRSIGHKAIFVANSWRTLQCIGWRHAEPVLRSLAYALLNHQGEPNPADHDLEPDRPWKQNLEKVVKIRPDWQAGKLDDGAATEYLSTLREQDYAAGADQAVELLNRGVSPQSLYDAIFLASGELLMRQPGIVALHAMTTTNAIHYAFQTAANDETRRLLLLQNAAFVSMFRQAMRGRGRVGDERIDRLETIADPAQGDEAVAEVFRAVGKQPMQAARQVLTYLEGEQPPQKLIDAARQLIFFKGNNAHDYKFSSAVLEDFQQISPSWRNRYLAASMYNLRGSQDPDNSLVERTRDALRAS